ncbi:Sperm motility kinase X [Lemmus lemmus]
MKGYSTHNINEVDIMKSLIHPYIMKLFQEVQTRDMTYQIMEYASKGDLLHHIRRPGGLQVCEAHRLFTQKLKNFCGTLAYCAPELLGVEPNDGYASDIWALGVLLYFMVARHVPFQATTSAGLRQQILAANFSLPPHVPINIFNIIV